MERWPMLGSMQDADLDCVLFDLDNTLVPFLPAMRAWARAWATPLVPAGKRGKLSRELIELTLQHGEDPKRGIETALSRWNIHLPEATLVEAEENAMRAYTRALSPYPGIEATLAELDTHGLELALVTDAPDGRATERLDVTGLADRFDLVITRDHTPRGKQGPEPFHKALDLVGTVADRTAMIGDWPTYDVRWPKRLGMRTILAGWGNQRPEARLDPAERPWAVADQPEDLPGLLVGDTTPSAARLMAPTNTMPLSAFGAITG